MTRFSELLILALAVWQAVEIWHHAEMPLIATARAHVETWINDGGLSRMLLCPFCLSTWAALALWLSATEIAYCLAAVVLALVLVFAKKTKVTGWYLALSLILIALLSAGFRRYDVHLLALAAARLANVGNDLTHAWCRTPGRLQISGSEPYDATPHPAPAAEPVADLRPGSGSEDPNGPGAAVPGAPGAGGPDDRDLLARPPQ